MTLTEVMLASVVFALSLNASGQLWGRSAVWSRQAEDRQEALQQLEIDLLRQQRLIRVRAEAAQAEWLSGQNSAGAEPLSPPPLMPCPAATDALVGAEVAAGPEEGLVLLHAEAMPAGATAPLERERWYSLAAHGFCRPNSGAEAG
jgi:hypothetical protein